MITTPGIAGSSAVIATGNRCTLPFLIRVRRHESVSIDQISATLYGFDSNEFRTRSLVVLSGLSLGAGAFDKQEIWMVAVKKFDFCSERYRSRVSSHF